MAKDKLTEYSATNASNDVIGDISVAEGMLPSAVNNALREQMTHLKNFSDGTDAIDALAVDNLRLDGNTISSTNLNGNVTIDPNGTGNTIVSSGNVGIGTSSPDTNLDVERSGNDTGGIKVQNTNNAQASAVAQVEISGGDNAYANLLLECNATNHSIRQDGSGNLKFINASTERLRINSSGNVGIGVTSTAGGKLAIGGTGTSAAYQYMSNTGGTGYFGVSSSTGGAILIGDSAYSLVLGTGGATPLHFGTNNNIRATIDSSGNVGIGTSSPTSNRILDANGQVRFQSSSSGRYFDFINDSAASYLDVSHSLNIRTNGASSLATAMTLDTSGKVGIGTSSPQRNLHVHQPTASSSFIQLTNTATGSSTGDDGFRMGTDANSYAYVWQGENQHLAFATSNAEKMRITSAGKLCLGTSSAVSSAMLSIVPADTNRIINTRSFNTSAQYHHVFQNNSSTFVGGITVSTTATAYNTSSDYRLKTAVTYDWDATTRLKQLRPARFKWIVDGDDAVTVDGFLAHEAQTVVPEAVTGTHNEVDDDGNPVYQGIDQSKLVPLLVKTIQELEARITALEAN